MDGWVNIKWLEIGLMGFLWLDAWMNHKMSELYWMDG